MGFYPELTFFSLAIAVAVAIGGFPPLVITRTEKHLPMLLSFSAGIMLGGAFLHLFPEAFGLLKERAGIWILAGFVFLYAFEKFITVHVCEAMDCEVHTVGIAAFVGFAIHALTEGVALGTGLVTAGMGMIMFLSIFLHKIPCALALTSVLVHEKYKKRTIVILQILFFAMVPLGAIAVKQLVDLQGPYPTGALLGFSIGTFLHISISDLLPEVHKSRYNRVLVFVSFAAGIVFMALFKHGF